MVILFSIGVDGGVKTKAGARKLDGGKYIANRCVARQYVAGSFKAAQLWPTVVTYPFTFKGDGISGGYREVAMPWWKSTRNVTVVVGIVAPAQEGCSAASMQPLDERRQLWKKRLSGACARRWKCCKTPSMAAKSVAGPIVVSCFV